MSVRVNLDMFRNSYAALKAPATVAWTWPGFNLTSQAINIHRPFVPELDVRYCLWRLCWKSGVTSGASTNAVRLVAAENGPSNIREIGVIRFGAGGGHRNDGIDVTQLVRDLIADATARNVELNFIHQTSGNGSVGPSIWCSALEVVYA